MISNFVTLNEPIIQAVAFEKFLGLPSLIPTLANVIKSSKHKETFQEINGGSNGFQPFTGTVSVDQMTEGYTKEIEAMEFANSFQILKSALNDDQYGILKQRSKNLGRLAHNHRENYFFDLFNFAFATTKATGGDGLSLCSSAHTSTAPGVADQSNAGSTTLSYAEVFAARLAMKKFKDSSGQKVQMNPDTILIPLELDDTLFSITNSMFQSAALQESFLQGKWKCYSSNFLTDTANWFMIDSGAAKDACHWINREPFTVLSDESVNTLSLNTVAYYRCSRGFSDWRWVYGENV